MNTLKKILLEFIRELEKDGSHLYRADSIAYDLKKRLKRAGIDLEERPRRSPPSIYRRMSWLELEELCDDGDEDACTELQLRELARDVQSEGITEALKKLYKR